MASDAVSSPDMASSVVSGVASAADETDGGEDDHSGDHQGLVGAHRPVVTLISHPRGLS